MAYQADAASQRSKATGLSRKSSVTSRQSQLIRKNTGAVVFSFSLSCSLTTGLTMRRLLTGPTDLRPSDILIERFEAWKNITKNLISYFEGQFLFSFFLFSPHLCDAMKERASERADMARSGRRVRLDLKKRRSWNDKEDIWDEEHVSMLE